MTEAPKDIEALIEIMARLPGLGPRSARRAVLQLIKKREALLSPLVDHLKSHVAAPLLGCAASALRCPRRTWYARMHGGAQNRVVHQDVAGRAHDGWLNLWLLLSDGVYGRPLVLLDPGGALVGVLSLSDLDRAVRGR